MGKFFDLTGMFFADGNIEVIKRAPTHILPSGQKQTMWECKCSCGNIFIANSYNIRNGIVKSCGCKASPIFIDLKGMKFERLKVIKKVDNYITSRIYNDAMWECECECGNKVVIPSIRLRNGTTKSCGCLARELSSKRAKDRIKDNTYDLSGDFGIGYTDSGKIFYFDLEDYDKIKDYKWKIEGQKITTYDNTLGKRISLKRLIMDCPEKMRVRNINSNFFDNRKQNLKTITCSQDQMGKGMQSNNTSGHKGVSWSKQHKKWEAYITINRHRKHLGIFKNQSDAIKARKEAEEKYFGEYSYDNKMKGVKNNE